jgi:hypothetical protein
MTLFIFENTINVTGAKITIYWQRQAAESHFAPNFGILV